MDDLVERVARALYFKSLERDNWDGDDDDGNTRWETAKLRVAENPTLYSRPSHAFEDAGIAIRCVLDVISEPSDEMQTIVHQLAQKIRNGDISEEGHYRAMIAALRKEFEHG